MGVESTPDSCCSTAHATCCPAVLQALLETIPRKFSSNECYSGTAEGRSLVRWRSRECNSPAADEVTLKQPRACRDQDDTETKAKRGGAGWSGHTVGQGGTLRKGPCLAGMIHPVCSSPASDDVQRQSGGFTNCKLLVAALNGNNADL